MNGLEIVRVVSMALMWVTAVLNVLGFCSNIKSYKKWGQTIKNHEAAIDELGVARDKYLEATEKLGLTQRENEI